MPDKRPDPVQPADDDARALAQGLLQAARHAALAYTDPATGTPGISRIAFGLGPDGMPVTLVSALSAHHAALVSHPAAAVMVGEPGDKGDPLTHPRLMLRVTAEFIDRGTPDHGAPQPGAPDHRMHQRRPAADAAGKAAHNCMHHDTAGGDGMKHRHDACPMKKEIGHAHH